MTRGNGREEKVVPDLLARCAQARGPDSRRKTSRLPFVLPLSVAKKKLLCFFQKTKLIQNKYSSEKPVFPSSGKSAEGKESV